MAVLQLEQQNSDVPMLGRTLLQPALVISFGFKLVSWVVPLVRARERLRTAALKNAESMRIARQRAERELLAAKETLERKTEELQQQREWFEVTLSSIGDAVITTDVEGKVTYLNPVAESLMGWSLTQATCRWCRIPRRSPT